MITSQPAQMQSVISGCIHDELNPNYRLCQVFNLLV